MPWWPDTAVMGLTIGIIVTIAVARSRADRETNRRLWSAGWEILWRGSTLNRFLSTVKDAVVR